MRWGIAVFVVVFFTMCGLVIRHMAATNDQGLVLEGLIRLSVEHATIFYWVLSWMSFAMVAFAVFSLAMGLANPQSVTLADDGVYVPNKPWSRQRRLIRYSDISAIVSHKVRHIVFVKIVHAGGKKDLPDSMFESKRAFEEFRQGLLERCKDIDKGPG
jgi:hypothetical protein